MDKQDERDDGPLFAWGDALAKRAETTPPRHVAEVPTSPPEELYGIAWDKLRQGVDARVTRFVKVNRKKLSRAHMQYLVKLYNARYEQDGWLKISRKRIVAKRSSEQDVEVDPDVQTGDYALLRVWGLAEFRTGHRGIVRITPYGKAFVEGRVKVPEAAFVINYRNTVVCFDGPRRSFAEVHATSFKHEEL